MFVCNTKMSCYSQVSEHGIEWNAFRIWCPSRFCCWQHLLDLGLYTHRLRQTSLIEDVRWTKRTKNSPTPEQISTLMQASADIFLSCLNVCCWNAPHKFIDGTTSSSRRREPFNAATWLEFLCSSASVPFWGTTKQGANHWAQQQWNTNTEPNGEHAKSFRHGKSFSTMGFISTYAETWSKWVATKCYYVVWSLIFS